MPKMNDMSTLKSSKSTGAVRPLHDMFAAVPARYDLLNRVLTLGFDERWRQQAALECLRDSPRRVLDLCCGTGDLALHLARMTKSATVVSGVDFCEPMLEVAREKAKARILEHEVTFVHGDAGDLPFPDGHFDAIGMSFAFRNITYRNPMRDSHLAEMVRVTSPGGRCVIVETSQPRNSLWQAVFHLYLRIIVPQAGRIISGRSGAYRYLAESARRYYRAEEVSQILIEAGFREVRFRQLLGGIAAIHVATR